MQGPPDLIVEILSDATRKRDELTKRKVYERYGVHEYWIVDPDLETIKVFRLRGDQYVRIAELSKKAHETITSSLPPEFHLRLAEVFE